MGGDTELFFIQTQPRPCTHRVYDWTLASRHGCERVCEVSHALLTKANKKALALIGHQQTGAFGLLTLAVGSGVGLLRLAALWVLLAVEEVLCASGRTVRGC